jgi:hypothetical protein
LKHILFSLHRQIQLNAAYYTGLSASIYRIDTLQAEERATSNIRPSIRRCSIFPKTKIINPNGKPISRLAVDSVHTHGFENDALLSHHNIKGRNKRLRKPEGEDKLGAGHEKLQKV